MHSTECLTVSRVKKRNKQSPVMQVQRKDSLSPSLLRKEKVGEKKEKKNHCHVMRYIFVM